MTLLPIIDEISACKTPADMAEWLIRCPDGVVAGWNATIRTALEARGFAEAIDYLNARYALSWCVRLSDGSYPPTMLQRAFYCEGVMLETARRAAE